MSRTMNQIIYPSDIHEIRYETDEIRRMADRLWKMDEKKAADRLDRHANTIDKRFREIEKEQKRLREVMNAIESYENGDCRIETVRAACDEL